MGKLEKKLKHLDFIQLTITRMAANSFLLKAWSVTLVAAIFSLAAKDSNKNYIIVAYVPVFLFWILDAYYLRQEKLYRALYDKVRLIKEDDIDLSLSTKEFEEGADSWIGVIFSRTLVLFYGVLLCLVILITIGVK